MNSKIFVSIALILSIVTCAILGTVNASAFEQQEINLSAANSTQSYVTMDDDYLYREVEPNDSIATANIRISSDGQRVDERVLIGYVSPQDSVDFFEIYVQSGHTYRIKLTPYRSTPNLDLFLYDNSNTLISQSQSTAVDISEHIAFTAISSGKMYIKVKFTSGTGSCQYRLSVNEAAANSPLIQSLFPPTITNRYFERLGSNCPDNESGILVLTLGYAAKNYSNSINGVWSYANVFIPMENLKLAILEFVKGYNANPNHTKNISLSISIVNKQAPASSYSLEATGGSDGLTVSQRLRNHGIAYANMIKEVNASVAALPGTNRVTGVFAGDDSEVDWNTYDNTYAWISGYGSVSGRRNIYVNADCPIAANGAETLTNKGWNYLRLRNVCCNPVFSAYPLPQAATRQAARNWLDFFNWLQKKYVEATGSAQSLYYYNNPVGFMNTNQVDATSHFFSIKYIVEYIQTAYSDTQYNYSYLRSKYGTSLPSSWFTKSTWNMSGNYYQLLP